MWIYDRLTVSDHPLNFLEARSWGGGEIARFVGRHGTTRLSKMIFIGAVPPLMLKTDKNPAGLPLSVFDGLRSGIVENRSQFYKDISIPFYGYNEPNAKISEGIKEQFWRLGMQSSIAGSYDCVKAFSEDDFTQDLKKSMFRLSSSTETRIRSYLNTEMFYAPDASDRVVALFRSFGTAEAVPPAAEA